jgi:hypothetical protein
MGIPMPLRHRRFVLIAAPLAIAVVINVAQFRAVDAGAAPGFAALERNQSGDFIEVMDHDCGGCRELFGIYFALRDIAPDATIIIPRGQIYDLTRYRAEEAGMKFHSLGEVVGVEWIQYEDVSRFLTPEGTFDPSPDVVASGPGGRRGAPWAIAVDSQQPPTVATREFLLVQWYQPLEGSQYDYQDLLVETSLLPTDVRTRLGQ